MSKKQQLEEQKSELINDLMATVTILEELWSYHPDNPKKVAITIEYDKLKSIKKDIEDEIDEVEAEISNLNNKGIDSTELDSQWANESDNLDI